MPPAEPQTKTELKSDIEIFAKAYFRIDLTNHQKRLIDDIINDRQVRISRRLGQRTVEKIIKAYVAEGLNPIGRARIPRHHLPVRQKIKGATQTGKILALVKSPGGAYNFELSRVALCYQKRVQELRESGHNIACERQYLKNGRASNTYKYYLIGE